MPHAKKYTTPTTIQETEGALIIGYWFASRNKNVPPICERHMNVLESLDRSEEQRIENEKIVQGEAQRLEEHRQRTAHLYPSFEGRLASDPPVRSFDHSDASEHPKGCSASHISEIIPNVVAQLSIDSKPQYPIPLQAENKFELGPGPLTNENVITPHPPLPVISDPAQPYRTSAQPGTAEAALEIASLSPVEGAKVTYSCPSCGKKVTTGDVHAC